MRKDDRKLADFDLRAEERNRRTVIVALPEPPPANAPDVTCVGCHSEDGRENTLRFPTQVWNLRLRAFNNVVSHGHMHLEADGSPASPKYLEPNERKALLKCLKAEYFGGFDDATCDPINIQNGMFHNYFSQGNRKSGVLMNYLTATCDETAKLQSVPAATALSFAPWDDEAPLSAQRARAVSKAAILEGVYFSSHWPDPSTVCSRVLPLNFTEAVPFSATTSAAESAFSEFEETALI